MPGIAQNAPKSLPYALCPLYEGRWYPRGDSNARTRLRRPVLYPTELRGPASPFYHRFAARRWTIDCVVVVVKVSKGLSAANQSPCSFTAIRRRADVTSIALVVASTSGRCLV